MKPVKQDSEISKTADAIRLGHQQTEARVIAENAVRWCNNILTEVLGNYGTHLSRDYQIKLRAITSHTQSFREGS